MDEKKVKPRKRKKKKLTIDQIKRGNGVQVRSVISRMKAREVELTVICVVSILIIVLTSSYFIFSSIQDAKEYNTLKMGDLEIVFKDNDKSFGDTVSLVNPVALSDQVGMQTIPYSFKIKNESDKKNTYFVSIEEDLDMIEIDGCENTLLDKSMLKYSIDDSDPISFKDIEDNYILEETLSGNKEISHSIRIWVSKDYKELVKDKHFHAKIVISNEKDIEEESYEN